MLSYSTFPVLKYVHTSEFMIFHPLCHSSFQKHITDYSHEQFVQMGPLTDRKITESKWGPIHNNVNTAFNCIVRRQTFVRHMGGSLG